jgi:hypothetical protein
LALWGRFWSMAFHTLKTEYSSISALVPCAL